MTQHGRTSVLFAIPELDRGGPDRVLFEILTRLDRSRFAPAVMVSERSGHYLSLLPSDVPVEVLGGSTRMARRYPVWPSLRSVRANPPDVVFATQRMILTLGVASAAFPRRTRLIVRQANDVSADFAALVKRSVFKHRLARGLALTTLRRADAVICQSDAMRDDLRGLLGARARLHVIWNPVDIDDVDRHARAVDRTLPGRPSLISVGRLTAQKGFDLLLPAVARLRARHPALHLTIFGDGPDREALIAQAAALGISDATTFAGFTPEPLPFVRAADLFVLASRYEGFPNAALEALACGTPIVLTDCPGANSDIVVAGKNGRLATSTQVEAIEAALAAAVTDLPSHDRPGIQADCRRRFSADRIVAAYEDVISSVTTRGAS